MTVFYPDVSGWNYAIDLAGAPAVCAKSTEGTGYLNPYYAYAKAEAARHGAFFFAYHFLHAGNGAAQAAFCYGKTGKTPLMLDFEEAPTDRPGVADAVAFVDSYRALGGIVYLVYLPKWYWQRIGSPSLAPLTARKLALVSSAYPASGYSDSGSGWAPYGGMTPAIWQYTSTRAFNGQKVDFNAYKGTVDQLRALVSGGNVPAPRPESLVLRQGDTGPAVAYLQKRLNVYGAKIVDDGVFGPATLAAVEAFQRAAKLAVDGVVGPATWAALDQAPAAPKPPDPPRPPAPPKPATVKVPALAGKSAAAAHNALVAAHLTHQGGIPGAAIVTGTAPAAGTPVAQGTLVNLKAANPPTISRANSPYLSWAKLAQLDLNKARAGLVADGAFGARTEAAVRAFQKSHGLPPDGIVGPATWAKLGAL